MFIIIRDYDCDHVCDADYGDDDHYYYYFLLPSLLL